MDPASILKLSTSLFGLFGKKKQTTKSSVDYVQLVKNAKEAGLNPLTALRNGGAAAFASQTTSLPGLASTETLENALKGLAPTVFRTDAEKRDEEMDQMRHEMMQLELSEMKRDAELVKKKDFGFSIPHTKVTSKVNNGIRPGLSATDGPTGYSNAANHDNWTGLEPIPSHIPVRNQNGTITYVVNPEMPDGDQMLVVEPANAAAANLQGWFGDKASEAHNVPPTKSKRPQLRTVKRPKARDLRPLKYPMLVEPTIKPAGRYHPRSFF